MELNLQNNPNQNSVETNIQEQNPHTKIVIKLVFFVIPSIIRGINKVFSSIMPVGVEGVGTPISIRQVLQPEGEMNEAIQGTVNEGESGGDDGSVFLSSEDIYEGFENSKQVNWKCPNCGKVGRVVGFCIFCEAAKISPSGNTTTTSNNNNNNNKKTNLTETTSAGVRSTKTAKKQAPARK